MKNFYIGIDVGGTNIKFGLVDQSGHIFDRSRLLTKDCKSSPRQLILALCGQIQMMVKKNALSQKYLAGIGVGVPGLVDARQGIVKSLTNIFGWKNVSLASQVKKELGVPVFLDNDVNLIALGEWKYGAGKNCANLVCITLGTGVGGGLILNNALYRGEGFTAGEIGHIPINEQGPQCNCGSYGCLERYVGNQYLLQRARKIFKQKSIQLEDVSRMAREGNAKAIAFWEQAGEKVGQALAGVVNVLNPRRIIIGGGVAKSFRFLVPGIRRVIQMKAMKIPAAMVKVVPAKLGDDAGLLGAQVLVKEWMSRDQKI